MKIALIQFDILLGQVSTNEAVVEKLIAESAEHQCQAVVLPELWNMGYVLERLDELAQSMSGSSVKLLQGLAKKYKLMIFGGTIGEKKNGSYYNTQLVINQEGEIIHKYRKIHLFPLSLEESRYFEAGDEWGLVDTPWGAFGLITCYDLRFPELIRNLVLRGAKAIVAPAQWPAVRAEHWQILAQARAIENQVHVFAVNRIGKDKSGKYMGCSMIIDPWGKIVAGGAVANKAGLIIADVDFDLSRQAAAMIPVFAGRRHILDEIDDNQL